MKSGLGKSHNGYEDRLISLRYVVGLIQYPWLMVMLLFYISASSCNPQFDVYTNNGKYYSIFGFLNVSADTQYIRVEELRDSLPRSTPAHLNVVVKLTDETSNQSVILHDSLVQFEQGPVHNYYTTEKIMPLHTYRLTVEGPNGAQSSVQITMPDTFPRPVVEQPIENALYCYSIDNAMTIRIKGISRLVAVNAIYETVHTVQSPIGDLEEYKYWLVKDLKDTLHQANGSILARIYYNRDLCTTDVSYQDGISVKRVLVVIAAGNPDWPNLVGLDTETGAVPVVVSNVQNGVGFLGVSSRIR